MGTDRLSSAQSKKTGEKTMARMLLKNCRVWDGSGAPSYPADVLIEGERIRAVATTLGCTSPIRLAAARTIVRSVTPLPSPGSAASGACPSRP